MIQNLYHLAREHVYNQIRNYLPDDIAVHNGVAVWSVKYLDLTKSKEWEEEVISAVRENVKSGDKVIEIGGGLGVSAVVAARHCGKEGEVVSYEADLERIEKARDVVDLNEMGDRVSMEHGIVGNLKIDDTFNAPQISYSSLPECDVLIMDCEGSERDILPEYDGNANTVIVETHEPFGSPSGKIIDIMENKGYEVVRTQNMKEGIDIITLRNE